jgi:hypothetical protein
MCLKYFNISTIANSSCSVTGYWHSLSVNFLLKKNKFFFVLGDDTFYLLLACVGVHYKRFIELRVSEHGVLC